MEPIRSRSDCIRGGYYLLRARRTDGGGGTAKIDQETVRAFSFKFSWKSIPIVLELLTRVAISRSEAAGKKSQGFTQRIMDNIKFEIKELKLRIQFLGKEFRLGASKQLPPTVHVAVKDIVVHSTNSKWEVVDLQEVYKMSHKDEVLLYKEVHVGSFTLQLEPKEGANLVSIIDSLPLRVRTKVKKAFFGGPTILHQIEFALVNGLALSMHHLMFKQCQDVVDAVLECLYRPAVASVVVQEVANHQDSVSQSTAEAPAAAAPAPDASSKGIWGRMSNILGSYSYWGYGKQQESPVAPAAAAPPELEAPVPLSSQPQATDDDGYATPPEDEEDVYVPEEKGALMADDEDISYSCYQVVIPTGSVDLFEYVLETTKGICNFKFSNFALEFIPRIEREIDRATVTRAEAHIKIDSYSLTALQPGPERHPDYLNFVRSDSTKPDPQGAEKSVPQAMFMLDFFKIADEPGKKPLPNSKQLSVFFRNVHIVFDLAIWESIYMFFFGGAKGRRFEQYMGQNLEYMLEAALSDTMRFEISTSNPTIVLPPFANKFPGKPHLASKVLTLHTTFLRFRSAARGEQPPPEFSTGLFGHQPSRFPRRLEDFLNDEKSYSSQRFVLEIEDLGVDLQAAPSDPPQRILQPIKLYSHIARHEFVKEPKSSPQVETFTLINGPCGPFACVV